MSVYYRPYNVSQAREMHGAALGDLNVNDPTLGVSSEMEYLNSISPYTSDSNLQQSLLNLQSSINRSGYGTGTGTTTLSKYLPWIIGGGALLFLMSSNSGKRR